MMKLKLQYFGLLMRRTDWKRADGEDPDAGKDWRWEERGTREDEMVGWHHRLNAHEFEQALGIGNGQGSLVCCSPWGHKEQDTTEWLSWTELDPSLSHFCSPHAEVGLPFPDILASWSLVLPSGLSLFLQKSHLSFSVPWCSGFLSLGERRLGGRGCAFFMSFGT